MPSVPRRTLIEATLYVIVLNANQQGHGDKPLSAPSVRSVIFTKETDDESPNPSQNVGRAA
jgi:hypothetical protein